MINSILQNYKVEDNSDLKNSDISRNPYVSQVFNYAVKQATSALGSYWSTEEAEKIISDETFGYIWNNSVNIRGELLSVLVGIAMGTSSSYYRVKSLSKEFSSEFLEKLYEKIPVDLEEQNNSLRLQIIPCLFPDYDYLKDLNRVSLIEEDNSDIYNMWKKVAMIHSKDSNVYDFLWSKVKRAKGATDLKREILNEAIKNDALSDSLTKKIAKSSPKSLKRVVVTGLQANLSLMNRNIKRMNRNPSEYSPEEILEEQKNVAKKEALAMLFVGCDDYTVVESLIDCLSRDNLPWLMPAASGHYWLSQRLSRTLEEE